MSGGHDAEAGAADRALVLVLLGALLLLSPARLLWARGPLAVGAVFAVWAALIAFAALATRADRADRDGRADAGRHDAAHGDREPPP
ncbi:hypothetical protein WMF18_12875 [Sorangium sp. So ce315]|uniref:hypothetical protein n=1 Tax=Sorangium sp. So ce315 TaxID=3133299 RepID=UPI003F5F4CA2